MLRKFLLGNPFALPRLKRRILLPAGAALLALLGTGAALLTLRPPAGGEDMVVALTSGGKFAARVPGAPTMAAPPPAPAFTLPSLVSPAEDAAPWFSTAASAGGSLAAHLPTP